MDALVSTSSSWSSLPTPHTSSAEMPSTQASGPVRLFPAASPVRLADVGLTPGRRLQMENSIWSASFMLDLDNYPQLPVPKDSVTRLLPSSAQFLLFNFSAVKALMSYAMMVLTGIIFHQTQHPLFFRQPLIPPVSPTAYLFLSACIRVGRQLISFGSDQAVLIVTPLIPPRELTCQKQNCSNVLYCLCLLINLWVIWYTMLCL